MADNDSRGRITSTHPDKKFSRGRNKKKPRAFSGVRKCNSRVEKRPRLLTSAKKINTSTTLDACRANNRIIDVSIYSELQKVLCCSVCRSNV